MSFKADIPTLSANEVYTLIFEYEGTETIQLIVGDLTLETTDRRVVFTTTSPVNYIESNVNLTNLNMYEGYYESDDQGGEYTQESYIEGKTEITDNVMKRVKSPKIVSRNEDGTEESIITTPDDLELYCNYHYDKNTKTSSPCYQDTLDLTTGTITRKNIKVKLNDYIAKHGSVTGKLVTVNGGDMVRVTYEHTNSSTNIFPVQIDGHVIGTSATGIVLNASQGSYDGRWNPTSDIEHAYTNTNTLYIYLNPSRFDGIDYTNSTTITNWIKEQDFTLIIKINNASGYTEQLPTSINPLKSYYNGSIQTSSQQLAPTLKTTLPISNKFTTTNLTSGSTYNVYFDGTATKLDAGGTIITNPVSPCEVECGGTTLTIEGTDIQNVRVIETTVKNEVGNNGTSDVELSKIESLDVNGENIIIFNLEQPIKLRSLGTTYDSYNPVTGELIKRIGISETDGSYSVLSSPIVNQVEIDNIPRVYKNGIIKIYSDSNIYPMMTLEIPTTNKYDTSTWETGVYTQRNIVEIYFNDSTTPMIPTETLTLTKNHLLSGHMIIIGENPLLIKGNYTGRDIPYFEGMRSVEAIEIEVSALGSPDGMIFGKGGRK